MSGGHGQCCVSGFSMNLARTFSVARLSAKRLLSTRSVSVVPCASRRDCRGDYWRVAYGGTVSRLKDCKGLRHIAQLLQHPGQEFLALDLMMIRSSGVQNQRPESRDQGPLLDAKAKAEYGRRLEGLRDELEEERFNDFGRATRARTEMEFISQQLAAAVGLGGKDRAGPSEAERARKTVTKAIKLVIAKVRSVQKGEESQHPPDERGRS